MKKRDLAILLAILFGYIGVHKFYLKENEWGAFYVLLFLASFILSFFAIGLLGFILIAIIVVIDVINLSTMKRSDFNIKYNKGAVQEW